MFAKGTKTPTAIRASTSRVWRYVVVGVVAFTLGSATVVAADNAQVIGSLFYIRTLNSVATTPCNDETKKGLVTTTCTAVVDSKGQLSVSDGDTHKSLNQLQFDPGGNLKTTSQGTTNVSGTVSVSNFPATQQVSGTVNVGNLPAGRSILLLSNFTVPANSFRFSGQVDLSDCRSLVAFIDGTGAHDLVIRLYLANPDGSPTTAGAFRIDGTQLGLGTFFMVGGTFVVGPRGGLTLENSSSGPIHLDKLWLFCGH